MTAEQRGRFQYLILHCHLRQLREKPEDFSSDYISTFLKEVIAFDRFVHDEHYQQIVDESIFLLAQRIRIGEKLALTAINPTVAALKRLMVQKDGDKVRFNPTEATLEYAKAIKEKELVNSSVVNLASNEFIKLHGLDLLEESKIFEKIKDKYSIETHYRGYLVFTEKNHREQKRMILEKTNMPYIKLALESPFLCEDPDKDLFIASVITA